MSLKRRLPIIMVSLITIGVVMMISSSSVQGLAHFNDGYFFIKRHLLFLLLGSAAFVVGWRFPYRLYGKLILPLIFSSIILVILTLIPGIGLSAGGASRWLNLGFIQLQPVEILKFFLVVYVAHYLTIKRDSIESFWKGFFPALVFICFPLLLLAKQPDLGNIILILIVVFTLLFLGNTRLSQLMLTGLMGVLAIGLSIVLNPYQQDRIRTFLFPYEDPLGKGYHIVQSLIAIGSGGILGHGLGESKLKHFYLPLQYSDFIFSIICEEGGLLLASIIVLLFTALCWTGMDIAKQCNDPFGYYLAVGLSLIICVQAVLNMGVAIGLFPVTGIPLTFISFGGTSLISSMFSCGVLMNIISSKSVASLELEPVDD